MKKLVLLVMVTLMITVGSLIAETINIPGDYATIQEGIDVANDYDNIYVAPGTYYENLIINDKILLIINDIGEAIIDGDQNGPVFNYINCEAGILNGFTIRNGLLDLEGGVIHGGGIHCENSTLDFINLIVENNYGINGGGIGISNSTVNIVTSEIRYNLGIDNLGGSGIVISGEESSALINNVNIHNNSSTYGGGLYCHNGASVDIQNSAFQYNHATNEGGGIRLFGCETISLENVEISCNTSGGEGAGIWSTDNHDFNNFKIIDSQIIANEILGNDGNNNHNGGGIYSDNSDILIINTQITDNEAEGNTSGGGGGIYLRNGSSCEIENSEISDNIALLHGGGITVMGNSNVEISDTNIFNNLVSGTSNYDARGGGIAAFINGDVNLNNVTITENNAFHGGGIYGASTSDIHITKCLFAGNIGAYGGSMYYDSPSKVQIMNLTLANDPSTYAIFLQDTELIMLNSIIWSNVSFPIHATSLYGESSVMIDYSNIVDGESGVYLAENSELIWGNHNIEQDPLFVNVYPQNPDYNLQEGSPCIDTAINQFFWQGVTYSIGEWNGLAPDMGAFESPYTMMPTELTITSNVNNIVTEIYEPFELMDFDISSNYSNPVNSLTLVPDDYNVAALDHLEFYVDGQEIETSDVYYNALNQSIVVSFEDDDFSIGTNIQNVSIIVTPYEAGEFQFSLSAIEVAGNYITFGNQFPGNNVVVEDNDPPEIQIINTRMTSRSFVISFSVSQYSDVTLYINGYEPITDENRSYYTFDTYKDGHFLLDSGTTYNYYIEAIDPSGNTTVTDIYDFTTLPEGVVNTNCDMFELINSFCYIGTDNADTVFVFPGQRIEDHIFIERIPWNSYENSLTGIFNENWTSPVPENINYDISNYLENLGDVVPYNGNYGNYHFTWTISDNNPGINGSDMLHSTYYNNMFIGQSGDITNCSNISVVDPNGNIFLQDVYDQITLICNNAIRGDLDGDGEKTEADDTKMSLHLMGAETLYHTRGNPEGMDNMDRCSFIFPGSLTIGDLYITNNPDGYGIGDPWTYGGIDYRVGIIDTTIVGNSLTINTEEDANIAHISYVYPTGEIWEQTLFQAPGREGIGVYEIGSLEPINLLSERSGFVFTISDDIPEEEYYKLKIEAAYIETSSTGTMEDIPIIKSQLIGNYPNPFNPETKISFSLAEEDNVRLKIYNIKGQRVKTLVDDQLNSGEHNVVWSGKDDNGKKVSSGVYFYKMHAGGRYISTKKMILLK